MTTDLNLDKSHLLDELRRLRTKISNLEDTQTLFFSGPVIIFRWRNTPGWPVDYVSPNVHDTFGYTSDDFHNKKIFYASLIAGSDLERVISELEQAVHRTAQAFDHLPYRIVHRDGSVRWLYGHTTLVRNSNNEITHYYSYVFDISRQKIIENELNHGLQIQAELESEQLRLRTLLQEAHHRIKNHLQGLMGLLKQHTKINCKADGIINDAISQIESFAVVYELQAHRPAAEINFMQMLTAIIHNAAGLSRIPLTVTPGLDSGPYEVDKNRAVALALVVNELIINATKHSQAQGEQAEIKILYQQTPEHIILTITNPGKLPDGFDFQTQSGFGIGLELAGIMLPNEGAELFISEKNKNVVARLLISPPLLVNVEQNLIEQPLENSC